MIFIEKEGHFIMTQVKCDDYSNICVLCNHSSSFNFVWFFFVLAGKEDNHKISNWFEIWQDLTGD